MLAPIAISEIDAWETNIYHFSIYKPIGKKNN